MADPLSIAGVAIAVTTAALQTASILSEIVDSIEDAPKEISGSSRDLHAFQLIVSSLETTLEDEEVQRRVLQNPTLQVLVGNLQGPLSNCSVVMKELRQKILPYFKPVKDGECYKFSKRGITKWAALGGRKDVSEIAKSLMQNKMTLDSSMSVICTFCNVQSRGISLEPVRDLRPASGDTDAGFAMRRYLEVLSTASSTPPSVSQSTLTVEDAIQIVNNAPSADLVNIKEGLKENDRQRKKLLQAAELGDNVTTEVLLIEGVEVDAKASDGKTALHIAAQFGNEELVLVLLKYGADVNAKADHRGSRKERKFYGGRTPLHWAAAEGYSNIIQILLDNGANIAEVSMTSRRPLQEAVQQGYTSCAKFLVDRGAPINAQDDKGFGALHEAANFGRYNVAQMLLDHGADIEITSGYSDHGNEASGRLGRRTPLLLAAQIPHLDLLGLLITRGANIHARNQSGEMALHLGAWFGHTSVVRAMLDAEADIEAKDNLCEETPLFKAAANGHTDIVILLVQRGARTDHINYLGRDVLQHAQLHRPGNHETIRILSRHYSITQTESETADSVHRQDPTSRSHSVIR